VRLPGSGGHVPADGLKVGGSPTRPVDLPGVILAATATLGLGLVLGPEAPLIAIRMGLGILAVRLVAKGAPEQALGLMAAAGSFAAVATIFGSPVTGAVLLIEATGLAGRSFRSCCCPACWRPGSARSCSSVWGRYRG
jgi:H+/Cl- antiporter ClcA